MSAQNTLLAGLIHHEREEDAYAVETEGCEQKVMDGLMDALEQHEASVERQFIEWAADDSKAFIWAMLHPGERTHREIIANWREKWVRELIDENGWQSVSKLYGLGIE